MHLIYHIQLNYSVEFYCQSSFLMAAAWFQSDMNYLYYVFFCVDQYICFLLLDVKLHCNLEIRFGGGGDSDNNPLSEFFVGSLTGFNWLSMVRTNIRDQVAYCSASLSNQLFLMNMQPFTYVSAFVSTSDGKHWGHRDLFFCYVWWVD